MKETFKRIKISGYDESWISKETHTSYLILKIKNIKKPYETLTCEWVLKNDFNYPLIEEKDIPLLLPINLYANIENIKTTIL